MGSIDKGGDTLPIADTTAVVKGSADSTKLVRIEADGLTTGTTRVITMPDSNVDLTNVHAESHTVASHSDTTATGAELETLTDGSDAGSLHKHPATVIFKVIANDTALTVADGLNTLTIPEELNGYNLTDAQAHVYTVSSSGTPTFQVHNLTDTADMLSTRITIDANEKDSSTAAAASVVDTDNDDVATGDEIRFDCDVAGTGTAGYEVRLKFTKP
jgi:hypothetical protein